MIHHMNLGKQLSRKRPIAEIARELITLKDEKARIADELKAYSDKQRELEAEIFTRFEDEGVDRISVDGRTVYPICTPRATLRKDASDEALEAIRDEGLPMTVNAQTLSAWVREMRDQDRELPKAIAQAIEVYEQFSIGVTRR